MYRNRIRSIFFLSVSKVLMIGFLLAGSVWAEFGDRLAIGPEAEVVRAEPNSSSRAVATIDGGTEIWELARQQGWVQITRGAIVGWVPVASVQGRAAGQSESKDSAGNATQNRDNGTSPAQLSQAETHSLCKPNSPLFEERDGRPLSVARLTPDFWPESGKHDSLTVALLYSLQQMRRDQKYIDFLALNNEQVSRRVRNLIVSSGFHWLQKYIETRSNNPTWGHTEWRQASLPSIRSTFPQYPTGVEGCQDEHCHEVLLKARALDLISKEGLSEEQLVSEGSALLRAIGTCEASFEGLPPSKSEFLQGWGSSFAQDLCISSASKGLISGAQNESEIQSFVRGFWLPKLPSNIPMGDYGVTRFANDYLVAMRVEGSNIYSSFPELERAFPDVRDVNQYAFFFKGNPQYFAITVDLIDLRYAIASPSERNVFYESNLQFYSPSWTKARDEAAMNDFIREKFTFDACGNIYPYDGMLMRPGQGFDDVTIIFNYPREADLEGASLYLGGGLWQLR